MPDYKGREGASVKNPKLRFGPVLLGAATILAVGAGGVQRGHVAWSVASAQTAPDSSSNPKSQQKKERIRELEKQEFIREHSDASGRLRMDLWRKGVERQKHMQVAPYIGWHPESANAKTADSSGSK